MDHVDNTALKEWHSTDVIESHVIPLLSLVDHSSNRIWALVPTIKNACKKTSSTGPIYYTNIAVLKFSYRLILRKYDIRYGCGSTGVNWFVVCSFNQIIPISNELHACLQTVISKQYYNHIRMILTRDQPLCTVYYNYGIRSSRLCFTH